MKIDRNNPAEMADVLQRIPLQKVYDACNRKFFHGKLPRVQINWLTGKDGEFMPEGAHWSRSGNAINFRLSALARHTRQYQFYRVLVHEMTHAYIDLVLKEKEYRLLKDGRKVVNGVKASWRKPWSHNTVHHGELFGRESRRIAEIDGNPVEHRDCKYGSGWHEWAVENVEVELPNGARVPYSRYVDERRRAAAKMRKENRAAAAKWEAERPMREAREKEEEEERDRVRQELERQSREQARQARAFKAAAFTARLNNLTTEERIASLRKQLANPRSPKQFIPSIKERLAILEQPA